MIDYLPLLVEATGLPEKSLKEIAYNLTLRHRSIGSKNLLSMLILGLASHQLLSLSKAIAKYYLQNEDLVFQFDISEYQDTDAMFRLLGLTPKGDLTPNDRKLFDQLQKNKGVVLLLENVDKSLEGQTLLLRMIDEGTIHSDSGEKIDFSNSILILSTSSENEKKTVTDYKEKLNFHEVNWSELNLRREIIGRLHVKSVFSFD